MRYNCSCYEITPLLLNLVSNELNCIIDDDIDTMNVLNSDAEANPYPPDVAEHVNGPALVMVPPDGNIYDEVIALDDVKELLEDIALVAIDALVDNLELEAHEELIENRDCVAQDAVTANVELVAQDAEIADGDVNE